MPYVDEAIEFCSYLLAKEQGQLTSLRGNQQFGDGDDEISTYVSIQQLNRIKSLQKTKASKELIIAENEETCFYFYQAINGENVFLDPLCFNIF